MGAALGGEEFGFGFEGQFSPAGTADDALQTAQLATRLNADWAVLDGYRFGSRYQKSLRRPALKLLVLDDAQHTGRFHADVVLNQNAGAEPSAYTGRRGAAKLLLGARYFLLRQEFLGYRRRKRPMPAQASKILMSFGGSPPKALALRVLRRVLSLKKDRISIIVVAGPDIRLVSALRTASREHPEVKILGVVNEMAQLMAWADVAISGAGVTSMEQAFMGLPSLLIRLAVNQDLNARGLHARGCAQELLSSTNNLPGALVDLLNDRPMRSRMSRRGRMLVDGLGPKRVVRAMLANP